ncbi:MAG TPA: ABC-F family ATP-binding cassette domain-containing protein [Verrucomicrobiae bacterium]|nr:ABC-F family ATP-binding cassette domain-containing protein [Verrucomicrobiae bacterium]
MGIVIPGPPILTANDLALSYGYQRLLESVTLSVAPGEKVGLVGRNGSGKTSLLRILAGHQQADAGDIARRRGLRIGYLPQEFELDVNLTVRQNIEAGASDLMGWLERYHSGTGSDAELAALLNQIESVDGWNFQARLRAEASALAAPPLETPVGQLSGGEKRRVALCRALAAQPDLLLLDEPTNHLDAETILWLEGFLHDFPGAVIFVTHDRYFLDVIATRVIELAEGRAYSHPGNYTAYLGSKAIRQQIAEQSERRRQRFLREELEWVRAGVRAQRSKPRHRLETFYNVKGLEAPPEEREMDLLIPPPADLGNTAIELEKIGAKIVETASESGPERWLFRGLTLSFKPGQCTGILGRNGAGKTTLLRICLGQRQPDEGTVKIGRKVVFNYIDQGRMQLEGTGTVLQEISNGGETVSFGDQQLSVRSYLRRFLFADDRVNEPVDRLSGGERARLMLAKVLRRGGNVLVLDEPTNDLDLPSLRMLEEALADFDGTVLVVSHDRYFLDRICDQVLAFEENGLFIQPGNYSYYLEKKKERDARSESGRRITAEPRQPSSQPAASAANRPRKLGFKEQRELEGMEAAIMAAEERVQELERTLNDPEFHATRSRETHAMIADLDSAKTEVARLYQRWEELSARQKTP